jgi:thiamine kinase-like enzyme
MRGVMSSADAEVLVARLWPGRPATIEPLQGGITNRNFLVTLGDERVVLRIAGRDTSLLGIDRGREAAAARMAARAGVGPDVVAFVEPEGSLITRFVDGTPIPPERMRTPEQIARAAAALRAIHQGETIPGRFDAHQVVEDYRRTAIAHCVELPADHQWARDISERIREARGPQPLVPCHNDLLNANLIDDGQRIRIVDWEYAGMGDRFFDLANFSINHEFEPRHDRALLDAYFGEVQPSHADSLRLMRFLSDFREAMWGVVQQGISTLDVDFVAYAAEHFERLRRTAADPAFERALAETPRA